MGVAPPPVGTLAVLQCAAEALGEGLTELLRWLFIADFKTAIICTVAFFMCLSLRMRNLLL